MNSIEEILQYTKPVNGCLNWTRCLNTDGYPRASVNRNSNIKVHRRVFELNHGYKPDVVRHTCDNVLCLNPDHLIDGSSTDNVADRVERGRTHNHISDEEGKEVIRLSSLGMSYKEIASTLNIKTKRVEQIMLVWRVRKFVV